MQRARGRAEVALSLRGGAVRLDHLYQAGSAKAFLPRTHRPLPEVVFLNTSGGLTGGDRLAYRVAIGAGAGVVATTQTAERAYGSVTGRAEVEVSLTLGAGARLDWLPQETILFDGAALNRRTSVEMARDARLLLVEALVLGRAAMGERVRRLDLTDWREVRRGGVLDWVEPLRLGNGSLLGQAALLGPARAIASVVLLAPGAEAMLGLVRQRLAGFAGVEAAASAWGGKCVVRVLAVEALALRRALVPVIEVLGGGLVPRVWQV